MANRSARTGARARIEAALAECDFAEGHARHVANDETLVETGLIRHALKAAALPEGRADGRERVLSERQNLNDLADSRCCHLRPIR